MIPAPDFESVTTRVGLFGADRPMMDRLVSIVFADPASLVIKDLSVNRALWDEATGDAWDLFFAGYFAYGGEWYDPDAKSIDQDPQRIGAWMFSPRQFHHLAEDVATRSGTWRFSGGADLISFMAYGTEPDWASLRGVNLLDGRSSDAGSSVGQVVEGLRRWQEEEPDSRFAPGMSPLGDFHSAKVLHSALVWTAAAVTGGVLGNRADDLFVQLLSG